MKSASASRTPHARVCMAALWLVIAAPLIAGEQVKRVEQALAYLDCGDLHRAHATADAAINHAEATADPDALAQAKFAAALVASAEDDWLAALETYESSYTASQRAGDILAATLAGMGWAKALRQLGHPRMAERQLMALRASLDSARRSRAPITGNGLAFLARTQRLDSAFLEQTQPYLAALQPQILSLVEVFILREKARAEHALGEHAAAIASLEAARQAFPLSIADREILPELATLRIEAGQLRAAEDSIDRALAGARAAGDRAFEVALLDARVALDEARGQPAAAVPTLERQIGLAREMADPVLEARLLNDLGWVHAELSRFEAAMRSYHAAHALCQQHHLPKLEVTVLSNLAGVLRAQGRPREAIGLLDRAALLAAAQSDRNAITRVQLGLGSALQIAGQYPEAQRTLESALATARAIGDRELEASALHALGNVLFGRQALDEALVVQRQALALAATLGHGREASAQLALATTLSLFGHGQDAERHLLAAEALARQYGDQQLIRQARDLRTALAHRATPGDAREPLVASLEAARRAGDHQMTVQALLGLASSELLAGRPKRARRWSRRLLALASTHQLVEAQGFGHMVLGLALGQQKRLAATRREIESSATLFNRIGSSMSTLFARAAFIPLHEHAGDRPSTIDAVGAATDAVQTIERQLGAGASPSTFAHFAQLVLTLRVLLAADGDPATAFRYADEAKARALARRKPGDEAPVHGNASEALRDRQRAARARIAVLEAQARAAGEATIKGPWHAADSYTGRTAKRLDQARRAFATIEREIAATHPETQPPEPTLEPPREPGRGLDVGAVQALLDDTTTLVAYFIVGHDLLVWVVDGTTFQMVKIKLPATGLAPWVRRANTEIRGRGSAAKPLAALRRILLDPIRPAIRGRRVIVVPHGPLHFVPFAALDVDGSKSPARQPLTFSILPTISLLPVLRAEREGAEREGDTGVDATGDGGKGRALVLGNADGNLPHAAAEATRVSRLLAVSPLLGADASEAAVHEQASEVSILHFATHGVHDARNPLFSHLALAPGSGHDGRLEVREILDLDLSATRLVVLSACETARGELSVGDDIVGLARGFLAAGTPAVITSLWPVDDEATAALMARFYRHLLGPGPGADSGSVADALDQAQRDVRADPRWQAPYYWAAFVLTGDARPDDRWMSLPGG